MNFGWLTVLGLSTTLVDYGVSGSVDCRMISRLVEVAMRVFFRPPFFGDLRIIAFELVSDFFRTTLRWVFGEICFLIWCLFTRFLLSSSVMTSHSSASGRIGYEAIEASVTD